MASLRSLFCCMIYHPIDTSLRVSGLGYPNTRCTQEMKGNCPVKLVFARRQFGRVAGGRQYALHPPRHMRWTKEEPDIMFPAKLGPCNFPSTHRGETRTKPTSIAVQILPTGLIRRLPNGSFKTLPALVLMLSSIFWGKPAYADFKSIVLAEADVQDGLSSHVSSVESILAQQLARRFREMSDEELVDILQQLLKASRSSPRSENAFDNKTATEESSMGQEIGKLDGEKLSERITETIKLPETQQADEKSNSERSGMAKISGMQSRSGQADKRIDEAISDKQTESIIQQKVLLVDKEPVLEISGEANTTEAKQEVDKVGKRRAENTNKDGRQLVAQKKNGGEDATLEDSPRAESAHLGQRKEFPASGRLKKRESLLEIDPEDVSETSKSAESVAEPSASLELSLSKPGNNAGEVSGDLTGQLWTEWSRRRLADEDVEQAGVGQMSSATVNVSELWRNLQIFSISEVMNVVEFTGWVFGRCDSIGILIIRCLMLVLAFTLGRLRTSSGKDLSNIKEVFKKDANTGNLPIDISDGFGRDDLGKDSSSLSKTSAANMSGLQVFMVKDKKVLAAGEQEQNSRNRNLRIEAGQSMKSNQDTGKWWRREFVKEISRDTEEVPVRSLSSTSRLKKLIPKDKMLSKDGEWEENFKAADLPFDREPSVKVNHSLNRKWSKVELTEEIVPLTEEASPGSLPTTSGLSGLMQEMDTRVLDPGNKEENDRTAYLYKGAGFLEHDGLENEKFWERESGVGQFTGTEEDPTGSNSIFGVNVVAPNEGKSLLDDSKGKEAYGIPMTREGIDGEGQSRKGKWLKRKFTGRVLPDARESPASSPSTSYKSSDLLNSLNAGSRVFSDMSNHSHALRYGSNSDLTSIVVSESDTDEVISYEMEQPNHLGGGEVTVAGCKSQLYSPTASVISPYASNDSRASDSQPDLESSPVHGQMDSFNAKLHVASLLKIAKIYEGRENDLWESTTSTLPMQQDLDSNQQASGTDNPGGVSARKSNECGASNGTWRGAEDRETVDQPKYKFDSFVHAHVLWVRDADGVFLQQPQRNDERDESNKASRGSDYAADSALRSPGSSGNFERSVPPSATSHKTSKKRFDYRQLLVVSRENSPIEDKGALTNSLREVWTSGADLADDPQLRQPFRYGSQTGQIT